MSACRSTYQPDRLIRGLSIGSGYRHAIHAGDDRFDGCPFRREPFWRDRRLVAISLLIALAGAVAWLGGVPTVHDPATPFAPAGMIFLTPFGARLRHLFSGSPAEPRPSSDDRTPELDLFARTPAMMHSIDRNGEIVAVSEHWLRHLGYRRDEVIGRKTSDFLTKASARHSESDVLPAFLRDGVCRDVELQFVKKSGDVVDMLLSSTSERDAEGAFLRSMTVLTDVTDLKRAEKALRRSQQRLRVIADSLPVSIVQVDLGGRFRFVNLTFEQWHDSIGEQVVGKHFSEVLTPAMQDALLPHLPAMREGRAHSFETSVDYPDGRTRNVEITYQPLLRRSGRVRGVVIMSTDATERRSTEAKLRQAMKMEAVGQLTGGLAHDFNNLLAVVLGNLQLLERNVDDDEKVQRRLRAALDATQRGAELTTRLLAFSRQQSLEPEIIDINELLQGLRSLLHHTLGATVEMALEIVDDPWETKIDPSQLETAVLNLAINARDAMPNGGELTISTDNVHLGNNEIPNAEDLIPGDYVLLKVADTGYGIPPGIMTKVVQPFFTTKEVGKGSGLGLSMVYGFVKQSGGHVRIDSVEGRGTTIELYLPRADRDAAGVAGRRPRTGDDATIVGGTETILVVEDDTAVRQVATSLLTELGYRVIEADNGANALAILAQTEHVDLLFSDIIMPGGMNGVELARRARANDPNLRVLHTSGYAAETVTGEDGVASTAELLRKPYDHKELARKIRQTLDRS